MLCMIWLQIKFIENIVGIDLSLVLLTPHALGYRLKKYVNNCELTY